MSNESVYLDAAAKNLMIALQYLDTAYERIDQAYKGYEPGYPYADSDDARAWDYLDAIGKARRVIGNRLNTWDDGDYEE